MTNQEFLRMSIEDQARECGVSIEEETALRWFEGLTFEQRFSIRLSQLDRGSILTMTDAGIEQ